MVTAVPDHVHGQRDRRALEVGPGQRQLRTPGRKIGLSPTPFSSISTCFRAQATASWAAPMTCGVERIE